MFIFDYIVSMSSSNKTKYFWRHFPLGHFSLFTDALIFSPDNALCFIHDFICHFFYFIIFFFFHPFSLSHHFSPLYFSLSVFRIRLSLRNSVYAFFLRIFSTSSKSRIVDFEFGGRKRRENILNR